MSSLLEGVVVFVCICITQLRVLEENQRFCVLHLMCTYISHINISPLPYSWEIH